MNLTHEINQHSVCKNWDHHGTDYRDYYVSWDVWQVVTQRWRQ